LELRGFGLFCAVFGDNLVTVAKFWPLAHMSVTSSTQYPLRNGLDCGFWRSGLSSLLGLSLAKNSLTGLVKQR